MKKLLFLVATATLFFASCAKDAVQTPSVLETSEDFTAIVAGGRTVLDGTSVNWCEDDQLTIFTRTSHNRQYTVKSIDSSNKGLATFEYVAFTGNDATPIAANYALYPYDATATISGDVISTTTVAEQAYNPNEVDIHHAVMVAKATDTNLEFVNAGALLRFKVKMAAGLPDEFTLQSIKLVSAANALAGAATIDLAADSKLVVAAEGSKELSLTGINTTISAAEQIFYIALPATTFATDDLTVTFTFDEGEKSVALPAFELALNKIKTINYTINPDEFSGSTGQYGETVELQETEPAALAQELTEALADPEVGQIILPEMPAGQEMEIELTTTLTFGAASRSAEAIPARNLIIDGNGATITFTGPNRMVDVTKEAVGANLTLKNLTLVNGQSYMERGVNYNTNGKLVLDNVAIESSEDGAITYAVNCPSSADNATIEIKNSKLTGGRIALNLWGENMKVNITDSELYNLDATEVENYATIVLNNNGTDTATGSVMTITGGKISALDQNGEPWTVISNPALGTINISESTEVIGHIRDNVAIVDYGTDNHYACLTLQEAIDKAGQDKATAKLLTNITLEETVTVAAGATLTLDLNGFTISQEKEQTGNYQMILNDGNLTIIDSKGNGKISYTDTSAGGNYVSNTITNRGTLTVKSGRIENLSSESVANAGYPYAIDTSIWGEASETVVNIEGGTLWSNYSTLRLRGDSTTEKIEGNITGGTLYGRIDHQMSSSQAGVIAVLNISGGKFIPNGVKTQTLAIFGAGLTTDASGIVANISGGTFEGPIYINKGASVPIGDNFNTKFISGGSFTADPSEYVVAGCEAVENNGVWTISKKTLYEVGSVADLAEIAAEIAAGNDFDGMTIKLTQDIELTKEFAPLAPGTRSGNKAIGTGFKGIFDGGKHTISGLTITNGAADDAIGLFGIVDGGEVKDIIFTDVHINAPNCENAGTVAGLLVNGGKISGVTVSGSVIANRGNGGIVGRLLAHGEISNCVNNATIKATSYNIGGIVGAAYYTAEGVEMTISNCTNNGTVTGSSNGVGGIVGLSSANVIGCTNTATVTGNGTSIGGIVGEQQNAGSVINCTNEQDVTNQTTVYGTGGIVGWIRYNGATSNYPRKEIIEVSECVNKGSIKGGNDAGGIVGTLYSLGYVNNNENYAATITATSFAAGIVGAAFFNETPVGITSTEKVQVTNNRSTTTAENIKANCTNLYVHDNSQGVKLIDSSNTQE